MAKTRVHELAKEFGVESKFVLEKFKEMGEFVKSASSTVELPAEMRFRKEIGEKLKAEQASAPAAAEKPAAKPAPKPAAKPAAEEKRPLSSDEDYEDDSDETPPESDTLITPTVGSPALTVDKALTNNADEDMSGTVTENDTLTFNNYQCISSS